jgi:hypothetical protein
MTIANPGCARSDSHPTPKDPRFTRKAGSLNDPLAVAQPSPLIATALNRVFILPIPSTTCFGTINVMSDTCVLRSASSSRRQQGLYPSYLQRVRVRDLVAAWEDLALLRYHTFP